MAHKVYDQNEKLVFEGSHTEVYEFILKGLASRSADDKRKYENYLKYDKK